MVILLLFCRLFVQPMYDSVLLEQSMIYNRRKDEFNLRDRLAIIDSEEERNILADEGLLQTVNQTLTAIWFQKF